MKPANEVTIEQSRALLAIFRKPRVDSPHDAPQPISHDHNSDRIPSCSVTQRAPGGEPLQAGAPEAGDSVRYLVRIESHRIHLLDEDNLVVKWFVDALRYAGILPSDAPDQARIVTTQIKVAHKAEEKTVIQIIPPALHHQSPAP